MFEIERRLPYIEDRDLRHWLRQIIQKLERVDFQISDLYAEINELRARYSQFDDFVLPPAEDDRPE
jgi:uncharacterized protein (DUF2126 family)